jgi:hypothetical protein
MATSGSIEPSGRLHAILGLPRDASPAELAAAYARLREHIDSRARLAPDPATQSRYRAELEWLDARIHALIGDDSAVDVARTVAPRSRSRLHAWRVRLGWAALGALVLAVGLAVNDWLEQREILPPPAIVTVAADPPGAVAELLSPDDESVVASGTADGHPLSVASGDYVLRVGHGDCPDSFSRPVTLSPGEGRDYAPELCQGEGRLVIRSNVAEDRARVDALDVGSTGAQVHAIRVGRHAVEVRKQGYRAWTGEVVIRPDEEIVLHAELEPELAGASATAAGAVASSPANSPGAASPAAPAVPPPAPARPDAPAPGSLASDATKGRALPPRTGQGGSKSWHDAIRDRLVSEYDRNTSRTLDTAEEIQSIPCSVWQSVEASYETGGLGVEMTHLYGFDGSSAPANTLGITHAMRGYAYDRMKQCGLRARQ